MSLNTSISSNKAKLNLIGHAQNMNVAFNFSLRLSAFPIRGWILPQDLKCLVRGWPLPSHSKFYYLPSRILACLMRCNSLSWLKFWLCANEDNWMCPGNWSGNIQWVCCLTLSILTTFQFPSLVLSALNLKQRDCFADCALGRQHYSIIRDKYIAHQICGPVCGVRHGEGATVGCQMMSLLIFYRLTQLFPDTQFKYLRWRRFKNQKQTRSANDEWQEERTTMIKTFYGFLAITLVQGVFAKIIEMFRANICFLQIFTK